MSDKLDLLKIAQEEQSGDVFKYLDGVLKRSKVQPRGISDAVIWEGGNAHGGVKPVAHALTDAFAQRTLAALDAGLPFSAPMMARTGTTKLKPSMVRRWTRRASSGPPPATPWSTTTARRSWSRAVRQCAAAHRRRRTATSV
jgi:hypothetical protein